MKKSFKTIELYLSMMVDNHFETDYAQIEQKEMCVTQVSRGGPLGEIGTIPVRHPDRIDGSQEDALNFFHDGYFKQLAAIGKESGATERSMW